MKASYTEAFREQALAKVYSRGHQTIDAIATELHISYHTLKTWMKTKTPPAMSSPIDRPRRPADWRAAERLQALLETQGFDENACHGWCREHGVYPHHLQSWRAEFERDESAATAATRQELRELKEQQKRLERELTRKDKALAEAAALLVLPKKYQALWEEKDA
jgi:transposase-like protein